MPLPLIDLAGGTRAQHAAAIDHALRGPGFFAIRGHGVDFGARDAAFNAAHRFFALPDEVKRRCHVDRHPTGLKRGFDPIGWQSLDVGQPPDLKESFYLGVEHIGPNQWPDEAQVPGFHVACHGYMRAMEGLARRLMGLFEMALGLPAGHFDDFMRHPTCTTRLLHYPPQPVDAAPGQIGCGAHTDWGALTLLAQDDAGGLQVNTPDEGWIDVPPDAEVLIVNAGDMMPRWTNDRWRSTPHRVINRFGGRDRWSIAFFFDLDAEASIQPLEVCVSASNPPRYAPITAGQHLVEMYRRTTVGRAA
ncbi:MAG TPA: 2OG-Fe(II) oxygenase family protein [Burkholderiaceae bacterium]|nr:2OG-Fe(II) oxygenase family protein [Burkholderiaceae bacterium]